MQPRSQVGVGIEFEESSAHNNIRVSAILPGGPAFESNQIFLSDVLMSVDGKETAGWSLLVLADHVLGPPDTAITLVFTSPKSGGVKEVTLWRRALAVANRPKSPSGLERISFCA